MASWQDRHDAAELSAIADALSILLNFGYYTSHEIDLLNRLQNQIIGADDATGLQAVRDHRANLAYLNRMKTEATDLVKAHNDSDLQGDEN